MKNTIKTRFFKKNIQKLTFFFEKRIAMSKKSCNFVLEVETK